MPDDDTTNIRISDEMWKRLNRLKGPGDSFDDVLRRLVEEEDDEEDDQGNPRVAATAD